MFVNKKKTFDQKSFCRYNIMHQLHLVIVGSVVCLFQLSTSQNASLGFGVEKTAFWCQQQRGNVKFFGVFPGLGWDNLRNVEASQVMKFTFDQCRLTDDGQYLIPDNVFTVSLKTSYIERSAQMFEFWHNTSSLTSRSINMNAGLSFKGASISGSFSHEMMSNKDMQIKNKAVTVRVKWQFNRYTAKLQPHSPLSEAFRISVLSLASRIELNQTEMAIYEAQILVRDFGTHVLTGVTAGAALVKDDYLSRNYIYSQSTNKEEILSSASASFLSLFKADTSLKQIASNTDDRSYSRMVRSSTITALGGPIIATEDLHIDQWTLQVDSNLVPMDRTGDPLYFLITSERFSELPPDLVDDVITYVREAIEVYYEMNMISGCTNPDRLEFSPLNNFDDGTCNIKPVDVTFGGVYQTCTVRGQYLHTNPCTGLSSVNPKTGRHACPASYTAVLVYQDTKRGRLEWRRSCRRCGFLWLRRCCTTTNYQADANFQTYWCAASGPVSPESGYRFGGIYSSTSVNLVTGEKNCPAHFQEMRLLSDLTICLSDDSQVNTKFSVPFAGFFSCQEGNPLASTDFQKSRNLHPFFWPKRCPKGFNQHLATVFMGCAIHYCAESGALHGPNLPVIQRPPFMLKPDEPMMNNASYDIYDTESKKWTHGRKALEEYGKLINLQG